MAYSILLVEDDPHFGKQLVDLFRFLGYRTLLATSGEDALAAFNKEPSSFVLCDIMLPGMGGVEVIEKLRALKTGSSVPVMLMSAVYKNPRLFQRDLRRLNVLEFLPKPFSVIDVGRKVSTVLDEATEVSNPEAGITESGSWRAEEIREALGDAPPKFESIGTCDRVKRLTLFIEIFRGHSAGQLRLRKGRVSRVVYFLNGYPVWAESDDPADELGNLLVKERLARAEPVETGSSPGRHDAGSRSARRSYRAESSASGASFLVERKRVRQIVVGAFAWSTADYEFEAGDDFVDRIGIFEVNPVRCLGEAVRRYGAVNDLAPEIYPRTSQILVRGTQFRRLFPYLDLPPALKGLGPDMQAEKTVGDLFKKYARESQDLIKFLWLMFRLGISDTTEAPPEAPTQLVPSKSKEPSPDPASAPIETSGVPTEDGLSPRAPGDPPGLLVPAGQQPLRHPRCPQRRGAGRDRPGISGATRALPPVHLGEGRRHGDPEQGQRAPGADGRRVRDPRRTLEAAGIRPARQRRTHGDRSRGSPGLRPPRQRSRDGRNKPLG